MFLGNSAKTLRLIFQALRLKKEPSCVAPRELRGTIVAQCERQNPPFSGSRVRTLFHRSEIFLRARRAPLKKVEERG